MMHCPDCGRKIRQYQSNALVLIEHPAHPGKHIDPRTLVFPVWEWGSACGQGFVSDARFGANETVIKRTNRETTRKWRALNQETSHGR